MIYEERAQRGLEAYQADPAALLLAIESSCDETAASVLRGGRQVLSMTVHTQMPLHRQYGGVVPELASRSHVERVGGVVEAALEQAGVQLSDIAALAVTNGPGLVGALLVGVSYAKGLAFSEGLPLIGVNHLAGHIAANYLTFPDLEPPFTCLVASGGHSHIVAVESYTAFRLLGCTRDDAAGEAFDKVARALGLPYPGGPELEKLAKAGDENRYPLHAAFNEGPGLDMSFSGLKTAVVNLLHNAAQRGDENRYPLHAASKRLWSICCTTRPSAGSRRMRPRWRPPFSGPYVRRLRRRPCARPSARAGKAERWPWPGAFPPINTLGPCWRRPAKSTACAFAARICAFARITRP